MNSNTITLDKLPLNKTGKIHKLNCIGNIRRRMLDLGLVNGTNITPILISPSGDPTAFEFRGSLIAIRKEDSSLIDITII